MPDPTPSSQDEWNAVAAERDTDQTPTPVAVIEESASAATDATPAAAAEATPEPAADPYAGFSPEARAKLEGFDAMSDLVKQQALLLKETAGRVSSMQSEFARSRQAQPAGDAPTQKQVAQAAKDPEKWASLKNDFPEWGEGIEAFVEARVGALAGSGLTAEQVEAQIATKVSEGTEKLAGEFQRELIATRYRNWDAIVKTAPFEEWFKTQPADVQKLAASPRGLDAIEMLDLFHEATKTPTVRAARKQVLAAAVTASKGAAPVAAKSFNDLTPSEKWDYLAAERARKAAAEA